MGADNYSWRMVGRGEDEELARLRAENEKARALLARAHALFEMADKQPKKLLTEIEAFMGWASEQSSEGDTR